MSRLITSTGDFVLTIENANIEEGPFIVAPGAALDGRGTSTIFVQENSARFDADVRVAGVLVSGFNTIDGSESDGGDSFTVSSTGALFAGRSGIVVNTDRNTIQVAGTIQADNDGIEVVNGSDNQIDVTGSIFAGSTGIDATGSDNTIDVQGSIAARLRGVDIDGDDNFVRITGDVSSDLAAGVAMSGEGNRLLVGGSVHGDASGIVVDGSSTITVAAGGSISSGGTGGVSVSPAAVVISSGAFTSLTNHGTISSGDDEFFGTPAIDDISNGSLDFVNAGNVEGRIDMGGGNDSLHNSGTISGDVDMGAADEGGFGFFGGDIVENSGTIFGNVNMGDGDDTFENIGDGVVSGSIIGGAGNDTLLGGDAADELNGGDGDDQMLGGAGIDSLFGESGNDLFISNSDGTQDFYDGGADIDTISYGFTGLGVRVNLGVGYAIGSETGFEQLANIEIAIGGSGNDSLTGAVTTLTLDGGSGNDTILAASGNNTLFGGDGNDNIRGFSGFDRIDGGAGNDTMSGDFNADTFVFSNGFGKDTITDFEALNRFERIDLSDVTNITDLADLMANHLTQVGANALITDGVDSITLLNVDIANLDASDFTF